MEFSYGELVKQISEDRFGRMMFTVYNFAEEDGWVNEIGVFRHERYGFDDFEMMKLVIPAEESQSLRDNDKETVDYYHGFKKYVENELQNIPNIAVFVIADIGGVFIVKPKDAVLKLNFGEK